MIVIFRRLFSLATCAAVFALATNPKPLQAQSYPIDCAILLCLSGGWPASVPCARARAEFIRRITPWPVEPPLQIWRCPMGVSFLENSGTAPNLDTFDVLFEWEGARPLQSVPLRDGDLLPQPAILINRENPVDPLPPGFVLQLIQDRADIDISGTEFNFVRSIRVYDVQFAFQRIAGRDDECRRSASVYLGTYGTQGDFSWRRSGPTALPGAHVGLEGWGEDCPTISNRSVYVDWRDYEGNYGYEQVNY